LLGFSICQFYGFDETAPCVDVRLGRGIRVHAVLPPVSTTGALLSIRIPRPRPLSLAELEAQGFFEGCSRDQIVAMVADRTNLLVTGAGGSGKTTLLSALLGAAAESDRIVVIEDVAELAPAHPHLISLEARQPNLEGAGGIALDRLLREALRMRPDRLVVGECRGAELRELMAALNTGHDGGAGTLHANSLADVPARLEALGALAGLTADAVARQAVSAFGAVLHVARVDGRRRLDAVGRLTAGRRGRLAVDELPT
jgi:pilus assembly protein CpaF